MPADYPLHVTTDPRKRRSGLDPFIANQRKAFEPPVESEIQARIVCDLYERSRGSIVMLLVLMVVIRWALNPTYGVDGRIRVVFYILIAVNLLRWTVSMLPNRLRNAIAGIRTQFVFFSLGVALTSTSLAMIIFMAWPQMDTTRLAILTVITSGIVSGAMMSLGFSPLVYMIYWLPPVAVLFFRGATDLRPPWGADLLATSMAIYAVAILIISLDQRQMRRKSIDLSLRLSDLVVRDQLTSLHNRRFLQEFMPTEVARLARDAKAIKLGKQPTQNTAIGVFMLDLDFFKNVNDTHGHPVGDAVLIQASTLLASVLRKSDNLVRWGGEEFVVTAWVKHRDHVRIVAEKLRHAMEQASFLLPNGQVIRMTLSVGFCAIPLFEDPTQGLNWEQCLALADASLYVAKAEGRNRWVGIKCGKVPCLDSIDHYREILRDPRQAASRGLIDLECYQPGKEDGGHPDSDSVQS